MMHTVHAKDERENGVWEFGGAGVAESRAPAAPAEQRRSAHVSQEKFVILELPESPGLNLRRRNRIVAAYEERMARVALEGAHGTAGSLGPVGSAGPAGSSAVARSVGFAGTACTGGFLSTAGYTDAAGRGLAPGEGPPHSAADTPEGRIPQR